MTAQLAALFDEGAEEMAMHLAARADDVPGVKMLLERGAGVDALSYKKSTPLITAAMFNNVLVASELIKAGSNVNAKNCDGDTALHMAMHGSKLHMVNMLLKAGAEAAATNNKGLTPLNCIARREDRPDMTEREFDELRALLEAR